MASLVISLPQNIPSPNLSPLLSLSLGETLAAAREPGGGCVVVDEPGGRRSGGASREALVAAGESGGARPRRPLRAPTNLCPRPRRPPP